MLTQEPTTTVHGRAHAPTSVRNGQQGLLEIVRSVADPAVALGCLGLSLLAYGDLLDGADVVLAALTFLLTFPSRVPFSRRPQNLLRAVFGSWAVVACVLLALGFVTGYIERFDRGAMITWLAITPVAQIIVHWYSPLWLHRLVAMREHHNVVIVGANDLGLSFARSVSRDPLAHTRVLAFFDDRTPARVGDTGVAPLAGKIADVGRFVRENRVDQIYVALPMASQPRILDLLEDLRDSTASIYFMPDIFMFDLIQARVDTLNGYPVVAVCESPFQGTRGLVKRAIDIAVASVALLLTGPAMLVIALAIRMDSPGPAIFRQRRFGLDGQEIVVYKFRSMTVTEDGDKAYKQVARNDSRVTRIGAFLRRSSLDELPQFINVLQGRMSVVGPRPHAIAVNDQYRKLIPGYMIRHKVRPGITGWAQVNGYRGGDELPLMQKRIEHDLEYLRNWSPWLDLQIIARTVTVVFRDPTAY